MDQETAKEILHYLERQDSIADHDDEAYCFRSGAQFILDKLGITRDGLQAIAGIQIQADYEVVIAVRDVIRNYWRAEGCNYRDSNCKSDHIFTQLQTLQTWLKENGIEIGPVK